MAIDVYESIKTVFVLSPPRKLEVEKTECGFDAIQLMLYKYEFQSLCDWKKELTILD